MSDIPDRSFEDVIRHLTLSSVPRGIRWRLAWHLDSPGSFANWKSLAESLGLPTPMIMSIEDRVCYTPEKSCTLMLFWECLIPKKFTLYQLVHAFEAIKNLACIHVLKKAFNDGRLRIPNENNENTAMQLTQSLPAYESTNDNDNNQAMKIFITYSEDSRKMAKLIYRWLMRHGFSVSLDIFERRLLQENRIGWYDKKFKEADHIMILVSPQYAEDIAERGTSELSPITLYIHSRMQTEYLKNNCNNKRFIPIILKGATKDQGPEWLMAKTIVYYWPVHFENVYCRIRPHLLPSCTRPQHTPTITMSRT